MGVESGGQHDDVGLVQDAVGGDDAAPFEWSIAGGDQVDVVALNRPVEASETTSRLHSGW